MVCSWWDHTQLPATYTFYASNGRATPGNKIYIHNLQPRPLTIYLLLHLSPNPKVWVRKLNTSVFRGECVAYRPTAPKWLDSPWRINLADHLGLRITCCTRHGPNPSIRLCWLQNEVYNAVIVTRSFCLADSQSASASVNMLTLCISKHNWVTLLTCLID